MISRDIKKKILLDYKSRNDAYALFQTLTPICLIFLLYLFASSYSLDKTFALVIPIGWVYYRLFFPLHDLCHENLFNSKILNIFFGYFIASIFATPFRSFQSEHIDHHKFAGSNNDPARSDYNFKIESKKKLVIFLIGPLFGNNILEKIKALYKDLPFFNNKLQKTEKINFDVIGIVFIILMQIIIFSIVTKLNFSYAWKYLYFVILPGITISLFLSRLRQFLEHFADELSNSDNKKYTARTFSCSFLTSILFTSNSFQYHDEHHEFPSISSFHLPEIHNLYKYNDNQKKNYKKSYAKVFKSIWNSI